MRASSIAAAQASAEVLYTALDAIEMVSARSYLKNPFPPVMNTPKLLVSNMVPNMVLHENPFPLISTPSSEYLNMVPNIEAQ